MEKVIKGKIRVQDFGDPGDGVYVDETILSKQLEFLYDKEVCISFYISEEPKEIEDLKENLILSTCGSLYADYSDFYSDFTGYCFTNDDLMVGNHDLIKDISLNDGKYIYLICKY